MSYVETLNEADLEFGRKLWQMLRANPKFPIAGVFWLLEPDDGQIGRWRLIIASPRVDVLGPRDAYRELAEVTRKIPAGFGQRLKIELISPRHPMYQALRSVFAQTASVEGARLGGTQVGGTYIEGAYLYEVR
ncbi:MAG TPA: hypothetical protein VG206_22015 [Terriglobia bacterium]|nr:hypothetical protein [Terriglobia bacterium]